MSLLPRRLRQMYAWAFGYFWLPCPLCGNESGGHEWRDRGGKPSGIPKPGAEYGTFIGICPDCTVAGKGVAFGFPMEIERRRAKKETGR